MAGRLVQRRSCGTVPHKPRAESLNVPKRSKEGIIEYMQRVSKMTRFQRRRELHPTNWSRRVKVRFWGILSVVGIFFTAEFKFRECVDVVGNPARITETRRLFWIRAFCGRTRSRWFGSMMDFHLQPALRTPVLKAFVWLTGANADEARYPLEAYASIGDFFARTLKNGARDFADPGPTGLLSPADGMLVAAGTMEMGNPTVQQVKGATYEADVFLGQSPFRKYGDPKAKAPETVRYAVLYLAPHNYHRFHSPCDVNFEIGRHFAGDLLPVAQPLATRFNNLFNVNERVVLTGTWSQGAMHYAAVGAYNVGNIRLSFDHNFKSNQLRQLQYYLGHPIIEKRWRKGQKLGAGEEVGTFRLGSTVVLIFDAPKEWEFKKEIGATVRVGEILGSC